MMNVNQRKLFKNRSARNKLNQMGGIMASSPELMQTVQGFQRGGSIYADQPSMITSIMDFLRTGDAGSGVGQIQEQNAMRRAGITPEDLQRVQARVTPEDLRRVEAATTANRAANVADAVEAARSQPVPTGDLSATVQNIQGQLSDIGALMTPEQRAASEARMNMLSEAQSGRLAEDVFGQGYGMPQEQAPFMMPGVTPSPAEVARTEQTRLTDGAARDLGRAGPAAQDQAIIEAAKRGELGAAKQAEAIVSQGTPEEKEQSLAQLMNEFKQNAPEYKGMDRGLAIAKIGFAMAAGQDPRAIVNISKALGDGADMLMKEQKDRDAFKRQVDLSALQYGLGEIGKRRAQDRLDKRTFKEYVASGDFTYKGKNYSEGDTILISQEEILNNGGRIPDGLQDKAIYAAGVKAATERLKAITDAADEIRKEKTIGDTVLDNRLENYKKATDTVISAEAGIQLTENAILDVVEGRVTGISNALGDLMNRTANSIGINLNKEYESVADFRKDVRQVFQEMIPVTLGEAQAANSISNRDVEFLADAFITAGALQNGVFDLAFIDPDVLKGQLQGAIRKMRRAQAGAISQMTQIEKTLLGRTVAGGGQAAEFIEPYRVTVEPYLPTETGQRGGGITSTLGMPSIGTDDQGRKIYDLTGDQ